MKIIILGAGASYDSIYRFYDDSASKIWMPPLGKELFGMNEEFNKIINKYKGAMSLRSAIYAFPDIETYFQNKWDFIKDSYALNLLVDLINIQYYLSELFCKISGNYSIAGFSNIDVLVEKAYEYSLKNRDNVVFITFNYDTLIEDSFARVLKKNINSINDYIYGPIKLIKCHGSCNWFKGINSQLIEYDYHKTTETIYNYLYRKKFNLFDIQAAIDERYILYKNDSDFINTGKKGSLNYRYAYFPQLLIPLKSKDELILPKEHLNELHQALVNAVDILVIGWKGNEGYFIKYLSECLNGKSLNITVVNKQDKSIMEQFTRLNLNASFNFYENMKANQAYSVGSFSQYIHDINNNFEDFFKR